MNCPHKEGSAFCQSCKKRYGISDIENPYELTLNEIVQKYHQTQKEVRDKCQELIDHTIAHAAKNGLPVDADKYKL